MLRRPRRRWLGHQAVRQFWRHCCIGRDPHDSRGAVGGMYQEALLHGRTGSVMRAISVLDIALWDRNARAANLPSTDSWAPPHGTVPAYASGGYYLDGQGAPHLGEELAATRRGFRAVKMKVGRWIRRREEARMAAAREAIGPDVLLMLDANNAWTDVPTALRYIERYAALRSLLDRGAVQPRPDRQPRDASPRRRQIPVATGEIEAGRWRFKELLEKRCGRRSFKPTPRSAAASPSSAGSRRWRMLRRDHVPALVSRSPHASRRVVAQWRLCRVLSRRPGPELPPHDRYPAGGREGALVLPRDPGLGYGFDEAAIERCQAEHWV